MKTKGCISTGIRFAVAAATVALTMTGCFKKVTRDTTAVIKTLVQEVSGGENVPAESVDVYAYYTGTEDWEVRSYDDAVNRIITSTTDGSQRSEPDVVGVPYEKYETGCYTALPLTASPAMIVVVEPQTRMYACMFKLLEAENLPETFLTLIFHSWRDKAYTEGSKTGSIWNVFPPDTTGEGGEDGGTEDGGGENNEEGGSGTE